MGSYVYSTEYEGNTHMISKQMQLADDVQTLTSRMETLESQNRVLVKGQEYMIRLLNKMTQSRRKPKTSKTPGRRKLQSLNSKPTAADVSKLLHLPQALQKNITKFTDQMLVASENIPDDLFAMECLSENECEVIRSKPSPKDQARLLIRKIKNRGPQTITKFLEIVGKDHPELPRIVYETQERLESEHKNKPMCIVCVMKSTVDLKDIGDTLWEEQIISDDLHGSICESEAIHTNRELFWDHLNNAIDNFNDTEAAINTLKKALSTKYNYIVEYLNQTDNPLLSCCCCKPRKLTRRTMSSSETQTEYSTTSSRLPSQTIPNIIYDQDQILSSNESMDSLYHSKLSYESLAEFNNIDSIQLPHITSSTNPDENDRSRHSSGQFVPTSHCHELFDDRVPSIPLADSVDTSVQGHSEKPDLNRSTSHQSSRTICAKQSESSGDISGCDSSKPSNKGFFSDLSPTTPPVKTHPVLLMAITKPEEELTKENGNYAPDRVEVHCRTKTRDLTPDSYATSDTELPPLGRKSPSPHKPTTLYLKTKPRLVVSNTNVGVRRRKSRKSKASQKREYRRQKSNSANIDMSKDLVRDTEHGLKKPFNPLWRKGDLRNKSYLQPMLKPRWDYLQARRHNRMAHLAANMNRDLGEDSEFVTDSESMTSHITSYTV